VDFSNRRPFFDVNMNTPSLGRLFALKTDVLEVSRVPERVEVAFQARRLVNIPWKGENAGADGFSGNAPVAMDQYFGDDILLRGGSRAQYAAQEKAQNYHAGQPEEINT